MAQNIDKAQKSLFSEIDAELTNKSKNGLITYKKETVVKLVMEHLGGHGYSRATTTDIVNDFVEHFKATLMKGQCIVISKHGRLVPRLKEGGRPVRDLSRDSMLVMEQTATVTFSKTHKPLSGKVTTKALISSFVDNYKHDEKKNYLAKYIAVTFFACISRTIDDKKRMEVRGLGVFRSQRVKERAGRNPKTGLQTTVEEKVYPRFKISKPFRLELLDKLNNLNN